MRLAVVLGRRPAACRGTMMSTPWLPRMRCEQVDVGETRHVVEDQRLVGQQARDHQRQGGVLGAGNRDRAVQRLCRRRCGCDPCPRPCPAASRWIIGLVAWTCPATIPAESWGSRGRLVRPAPRLRLAALEVFPQRRRSRSARASIALADAWPAAALPFSTACHSAIDRTRPGAAASLEPDGSTSGH